MTRDSHPNHDDAAGSTSDDGSFHVPSHSQDGILDYQAEQALFDKCVKADVSAVNDSLESRHNAASSGSHEASPLLLRVLK